MSVTPQDFAEKVLEGLSLPTSANNLQAMLAWMAFEGGHWHNAAKYNPLNTTQTMPGSTKAPGTIVQAYPDWKTGLEATIKTLSYGAYAGIRSALAASSPPSVTAEAIRTSPWGTTALPTDQTSLSVLAAEMGKEPASPGSLGFPFGGLAIGAGAGALAAGLFGVPLVLGAGVGLAGYGFVQLSRRILGV